MPALIIEDGTIVADSNSFVTSAEFDTYLSDRGYTAIGTPEALLIRAYDFMRLLPWCISHETEFTVTDNMKDAQCEIAYRFNMGFDTGATTDRQAKREKVDVIEREFFAQSSQGYEGYLKRMPHAYALLKDLLCGNSRYLLRA